jgi:hypothetical protein
MRRTFNVLLIAGLIALVVFSIDSNAQLRAQAQTQQTCTRPSQHVSTPLTDLGDQVYIRMDGQNTGFTGGLYPEGSNVRPPAHEAAGVNIARQIAPLNSAGVPDPKGKVVMIGIGMSNAWQEFSVFINLAKSDPIINPSLVIVNGAQPGRTAEDWIDPNADTWRVVNQRLANNNLTPQQVQVAWVKNTRVGPGAFPAAARLLESDFKAIVRNLKALYPNIKIAYFSSRTNSYTYWQGLSPEPAAFETGFAVKWLIEKQINGDPELNYDPRRGPVVAPYLSWSAYLWIDGPNPRSDGQVWLPEDMVRDCTHPSVAGTTKVAQMLMDFFRNDATTVWFRNGAATNSLFYLPLIFHFMPPTLRR